MGTTMRIGMLKDLPTRWDVEGNWEKLERLWHEAGRYGVDLFMTPETFLDGYTVCDSLPGMKWTPKRFDRIAQVAGTSPYVARSRELCRQYHCYAIIGLTEKRRGKYYNTAMLLDRDGKIVGRYDKTHCPYHDQRFTAGRARPVFDLDFGRIGICICADRRWPETVRTLRVKGAQAVLMPTYGMCHEANEWWMRTRSYENECWIAFCHARVALITNPRGEVAAKLLSNVPGVLIEDLDLSQASDEMLKDRRPELYGALTRVRP